MRETTSRWHPTINDLSRLGINSLKHRRLNATITFMYDVINENVNCPSLRSILSVNEQARHLSSFELIKVSDRKMRLALPVLLIRMCKMSNRIAENFAQATSRRNLITLLRETSNAVFENLSNYLAAASHFSPGKLALSVCSRGRSLRLYTPNEINFKFHANLLEPPVEYEAVATILTDDLVRIRTTTT